MARDHGRILASIWNDPDFCARTPDAQRLYFLLLSQRTINNAGLLPLMVRKWARGSAHTSEEDITDALNELCLHEFVAVDEATDETLVRTFIRNDGVIKQPNVLKSALRQAREIESPTLRRVLARELRRIGLTITIEVADEISPEPIANPSGNPSETPSEPSEIEPFANPSATPAGMGLGMGRGSSTPVGGYVGGSRASTHEEPPTPKSVEGSRPTERCPRHIDDPDPPNCGQCADHRRAADRWDAEQPRRQAEARSVVARRRAEDRAADIARCGQCDDTGYIGRQLCDHDPARAEIAARGRAAVQAALKPNREAS